jgi:hypothetical protein
MSQRTMTTTTIDATEFAGTRAVVTGGTKGIGARWPHACAQVDPECSPRPDQKCTTCPVAFLR